MRRNLLQVVRRHYRKPYRRLLSFDYGPAVVSHLKQPGTVAAYIQRHFISHIEKAVFVNNPFNRFLLRAVLVTGYNPRRFAQQQVSE